ncbi:MAG: ATP-binding protein [Phycisphaerales bacterium]
MTTVVSHPESLLRRFWAALFVALLGVASVLVVFALSYIHAKERARTEFIEEVRQHGATLESEYITTHAALLAASGFFSASDDVTQDEWQVFVATILPDRTFERVERFYYIPRVESSEVEAFEQRTRNDAGKPFVITRRPGRRPDIDWVAPVRFAYPAGDDESVLGLDLTSSREVCRALISSAQDHALVRTKQFRFNLDAGNINDVTLFFPVYGGVDVSVLAPDERLRHTEGWVAVLLPIDEQLDRFAQSLAERCEVELYKGTPAGEHRLVSCRYGPDDTSEPSSTSRWSLTVPFAVDNTDWYLRVQRDAASSAALAAQAVPSSAIAAVFSTLITALIVVLTGTRDRATAIASRITKELESKERLLQHSGKLAGLGGWEVDLASNRLTWSEQTRRIHEVADDYVENVEDAINFYKGASRDTIRFAVNACIENGTPYDLQLPFVTATGKDLWVRALGEAEREGGRIVRIRGAFQDITKQVEIEQELLKAKEEAEGASLAKSQFLANMSHEIRTPMTAIIGYADILSRANLGDDERRAHLATIRRNSEHLLAIINDILDLSKIEAGRLEVERVPMSVLSVIEEVASLYRPRALDKGLRFATRLDSRLPERVLSDPVRLRQILFNLVSNAIKFTTSGAVELILNFNENYHVLRIDVRDSGIGMSQDETDRVFDAFTQADISTTREYGGTGLGLKISSTLAEKLGGALSVDSEPGVGSTFTLKVELEPDPTCQGVYESGDVDFEHLDRAANERDPSDPDLEKISLADARILVAEDGPDNQRLVRFFLEEAYANVSIVGNGELAMKEVERGLASDDPYTMILMDMQMPVLDGYSATRALRERGLKIPIVALTAHAMESDKVQCLDAGCNDHVAKPINRAELIRVCAYWSSITLNERRVA